MRRRLLQGKGLGVPAAVATVLLYVGITLLCRPALAIHEPVRSAEPAQAPPTVSSGDGRVKASPLARRIAIENGLDLSALAGSVPGGRIIKADVERAIAAGPAPVAPPAPATAPSPGAPAEPTPGVRERPETAKGAVSHEDLTKLLGLFFGCPANLFRFCACRRCPASRKQPYAAAASSRRRRAPSNTSAACGP